MTEPEKDQDQDKTDWSKAEEIARRSESLPARQGEVLPVEAEPEATVPTPPDLRGREEEGVQGILMRWREDRIQRAAALDALRENYATQLDILKHKLLAAATVEKARADVIAEEYLKELDSRHLEVLTEIGLRNKDVREKALLEITESTVEKLREVQSKDWPPSLVEDTIARLFDLRERVVDEMMAELGSEE